MSFGRYGDRLPQEPTTLDDDLPTSRTTVAGTATATQGHASEGEDTTPTGEAGTDDVEDASTLSSSIRIQSTTVALAGSSETTTFTTPTRASEDDSEPSQTATHATAALSSGHSTLATSTSSSASDSTGDVAAGSLASGVSPSGAQSTALPDISTASKHAMSSGEVAAAVIMPILAAVAIFAILFFCRRRRRRREPPVAPFFPAMREKMSQFRTRVASPSTIPEPSSPAPVVTNAANNAYYTGLDTSPHGSRHSDSQEYYAPRRSSGGTFSEPPPPYNSDNKPPQLPIADAAPALAVPHLREPEPAARSRGSPFEDPDSVSPIHNAAVPSDHDNNILLPPIEPPPSAALSRAPSFSSTQYSDTASVHSARAARMSVGGPQMIMSSSPPNARSPISPCDGDNEEDGDGMVTPTAERYGRTSVFDDPSSPVSSIGSAEFYTLPGSRRGSLAGAGEG